VSGNREKAASAGQNFPAPCLPTQRSFRFEALVRELSERDAALVMSALEDHLLQAGCFCFVASHRHRPAWIDEHPGPLRARSVDGLMAPGTPRTHAHLPVPAVTVSGHNENGPCHPCWVGPATGGPPGRRVRRHWGRGVPQPGLDHSVAAVSKDASRHRRRESHASTDVSSETNMSPADGYPES
jgi:hypothetical protein